MKREKISGDWPPFVNPRPPEEFLEMDERSKVVTNSRDRMKWQLDLLFSRLVDVHNLVVDYQNEQDRLRQLAEEERGKRWSTAKQLAVFGAVTAVNAVVSIIVAFWSHAFTAK